MIIFLPIMIVGRKFILILLSSIIKFFISTRFLAAKRHNPHTLPKNKNKNRKKGRKKEKKNKRKEKKRKKEKKKKRKRNYKKTKQNLLPRPLPLQ